ncbi:MAG: hypothetical protein PHH00_02080 [Candidatus Nanoarchaeia archaeon]|nr:hypothetical protein [Candidatus Nanoarchaeia archaeon]
MKKGLIIFLVILGLIPIISASDILVWQGQYYTGTTFNTGTYEFNFSVYDDLTGGNICYSNTTDLTTGNFGEWKTEQSNVSSLCNNASKDYYLNININGADQTPRKRLVIWNFLRKDVDEITTGKLQTASQIIAPIVQADSQIVAPIVNATQIVSANITSTETGLFAFLGSLAERITSLFTQSLDANDILTRILVIEASNNKNFTAGYDGSNNLYINQTGSSGSLQFMNTAENPQITAGKSNSAGAFYIDINNGRPIYLNGIKGGDVETGGNFTVGMLLKLTSITLPSCSIDGLIGKNATGVYYCDSIAWRQFQFVS